MDLFELSASIVLDTAGYEKDVQNAASSGESLEQSFDKMGDAASEAGGDVTELGTNAEGSGSKFGSLEVAIGNFIANALENLISKVSEAIQYIVDLGTETETAYAKLETIAGTENIDMLTDSIKDLSVQTGVSAADLADVAYNAISAGSAAEDAMGMVETATKLGVAGFTESSSALSVLSTAMNAYGYEADEVTHVSDSLIMTQNLGVTTVDELASSIGRIISTGAAYGVSLENIEAGYVALTKSGINTRISTTYLSSTLSELGDSGTTVAGIIKDQTGKSFAQLMDDGESLGDVLGILYDYVDQDNTAFMELWSSSNASTAAVAIIGQGIDSFNENLESLQDCAGATDSAYAIMADTIEFKTNQMSEGFNAIGLTIFDSLQEPMAGAIGFVNDTFIPGMMGIVDGTGDIFENVGDIVSGGAELITGILQSIIESLPDIIYGIVEFLVASIGDIQVAGFDLLTGIIDAIPDFIDSMLESLPDIIDSIFAFFIDNHESMIESAVNLLMSIVEAIPQIVESLTENLPSIISSIVTGLTSAAPQVLSGAVTLLTNIISAIPEIAVNLLAAMPEIIASIITGLADAIPQIFQSAKDLLGNIVSAIPEIAQDVLNAVPQIIDGLVNGLLNGVSRVVDAAKSLGSSLLGGIKSFFGISSPSTVMAEQGEYITEGLVNGIDTMPTDVDAILAETEALIENWGSNVANNLASSADNMLAGFMNVVGQLPSQLQTALETALQYTQNWSASMQDAMSNTANSISQTMSVFLQGFQSDLITAESTASSNWTNFVTDWQNSATDTTTTLTDRFTDFFTNMTSNLSEFLSNTLNSINESDSNILTAVGTTMESLVTNIGNYLSTILTDVGTWGTEMYNGFYGIGQNVIEGMISGLDSESGRLYSKIRSIMQRMVDEAMDALDIGSPSRVFRREVGEMAGEGLALGLEDSMDSVSSAMDDLMSVMDASNYLRSSDYTAAVSGSMTHEQGENRGGITVVQNIYSEAKTAADLMREARYEQQRAILMGVG